MDKTGYKYSLERGSKKIHCPNCRKKTFVRYIDLEENSYLPSEFGRCDREQKCGYFRQPEIERIQSSLPVRILEPEPTFLPLEYVDKYFQPEKEKTNNFLIFLNSFLPRKKTNRVIIDYLISTCFYWGAGATIFWQIDQKENVRTGQVILYDPITGKRKKEPFSHITWIHSLLKKKGKYKDFVLSQCLFGLHLIEQYPDKNMIAIVEAPKTACIMAAIYPKYLWLATCGLSNIKPKLFEPLKGKKIVLYPDLGAFERWDSKADVLKKFGYDVEVSNLLESKCATSSKGLDIADYFIS